MARVARVAMAGCALLTLAACVGEARSSDGTAATSTTASAPSTTLAPSTTSAPTTTLSPQQQDEAGIRALHDRFYRMIVLTGNPPDPNHSEIAATTTGIQRQRSEDFIRQMKELGERSVGDVHGRILEIQYIDRDHAAMRDCTFIESVRTAVDGTRVGGDDGPPTVTGLRMVRTASGWRVEDWLTGGTERCDA
jgi:hypothetical protein